VFDAVTWELGGVGGGKDDITLELGVDDLANLPARNQIQTGTMG